MEIVRGHVKIWTLSVGTMQEIKPDDVVINTEV